MRERERVSEREMRMYIYIYIYKREREREREIYYVCIHMRACTSPSCTIRNLGGGDFQGQGFLWVWSFWLGLGGTELLHL